MINKTKSSIWVLSDNGVDIWHLSELLPTCSCVTGQPNQREFNAEAEALDQIPEQYREEDS